MIDEGSGSFQHEALEANKRKNLSKDRVRYCDAKE